MTTIEFNTGTPYSKQVYTLTVRPRDHSSSRRPKTLDILRELVELGGTVEGYERVPQLHYIVTFPMLPFSPLLQRWAVFQSRNLQPEIREQKNRMVVLGMFGRQNHVREIQQLLECGVRWTGHTKLMYKGHARHLYVFEGDAKTKPGWFGRPGLFVPRKDEGTTLLVDIPHKAPELAICAHRAVVHTSKGLSSLQGKSVDTLYAWANNFIGARIEHYSL